METRELPAPSPAVVPGRVSNDGRKRKRKRKRSKAKAVDVAPKVSVSGEAKQQQLTQRPKESNEKAEDKIQPGPPDAKLPLNLLSKKRRRKKENAAPSIERAEQGNIEGVVNEKVISGDSLDSVRAEYNSKQGQPFAHLMVRDCFDPTFLAKVRDELLALRYHRKSNDLYDFLQSDDLRGCDAPNITRLRASIYSAAFRGWLSSVTGINDLNDTVDMSAARYGSGSTLLCHDDELEGRRIAYIIYLVPEDWDPEKDGGTLDLFAADERGQPSEIVESYSPARNAFFFFEVTAVSHHQVSEVLTDVEGRERLSISGWFHGTPAPRPPPYEEPAPLFSSPISIKASLRPGKKGKKGITQSKTAEDDLLAAWINELYLNEETKQQARAQFEEEQSIELHNFLRDDRYAEVVESMMEQQWVFKGPPNKRHYQILDATKKINSPVHQLQQLFHSTQFCQWLAEITQVQIAQCNGHARCFQRGAYTLVHDGIIEEEALDAVLCCATNVFPDDCGGRLVYMDEESELLSVDVVPNSLSLVFRDSGTMRFIKYINHRCSDIRYDCAMLYKEPPSAATSSPSSST